MGKFDGMDPKLVRELLAEVKQAAGQLRSIEGRVTQLMSGAGLATQTTHRPGQVADAIDAMTHDVGSRLALLEKKDDRPRVGDASTDPVPTSGGDDDEPKEKRDDDRSRYDNPRADDPKQDTKTDDPKPDAKTGDGEPDVKTDDKSDVKADDGKPDVKTDDKSDVKADDGKPDVKSGDVEASDGTKTDPKDDGRDQGAEPHNVPDTPGKDHPDDVVQGDPGKPQVVVVDGVKVLQVPLDPPTAKELADLIRNIDDIQPHDTPSLAGDTTPGQVDPGGDAGAGGVSAWANDGSDVVSVDAKPLDIGALKTLEDNLRNIPPMEMPGVEVPKGEWGKGEWAPQDIKPDGPAGSVDPGGAATAPDDAAGRTGSQDATPTAGGHAGTPAAGVTPVAGGDAGGVGAWADDGSDVVSLDAKPLDIGALKTLHDNVRDIQPMEMPGVEVPKGEWGKGEWAPQDIEPDGPPGSVEPGERSR